MSYTVNINKIDDQLKELFSSVSIDRNDYRQLNIRLSNPLNESVNNNLEVQVFVSQSNLNEINPVIEWGYFTDSNNLIAENQIRFRTPIDGLKGSLSSVLTSNRFTRDYLNTLNEGVGEEEINESVVVEEEKVDNINETYELSENHLKIDVSKLKSYLNDKFGIVIGDLELEHFDPTSGRKREINFINSNDPQIGDEAILELRGLSSKNYDGNLSPKEWITLENELRKIPHVEDINSNTYKYMTNLAFSTKVFVELH